MLHELLQFTLNKYILQIIKFCCSPWVAAENWHRQDRFWIMYWSSEHQTLNTQRQKLRIQQNWGGSSYEAALPCCIIAASDISSCSSWQLQLYAAYTSVLSLALLETWNRKWNCCCCCIFKLQILGLAPCNEIVTSLSFYLILLSICVLHF